MKKLILALTLALSCSGALAHGGGTDAIGCHAGSKDYHCHNKKPEYNNYEYNRRQMCQDYGLCDSDLRDYNG